MIIVQPGRTTAKPSILLPTPGHDTRIAGAHFVGQPQGLQQSKGEPASHPNPLSNRATSDKGTLHAVRLPGNGTIKHDDAPRLLESAPVRIRNSLETDTRRWLSMVTSAVDEGSPVGTLPCLSKNSALQSDGASTRSKSCTDTVGGSESSCAAYDARKADPAGTVRILRSVWLELAR